MDRQHDPSDLGLSRLPDDDEPTAIDALRTPEPAPRPASAAQRRAVIEGVCRGQGWRQSRREALTHPCHCGAGPRSWCRRAGQPVVGHVHHSRGGMGAGSRQEAPTPS